MKHSILFISAFIFLFLACSCIRRNSDNTTVVPNHRDYFSAGFHNYFLPGETGIMIFLSDESGNVLAKASLQGNYNVTLRPETGTQFPDHIIETLVYKGPVVDGKSTIYLYSYLKILPASWIWTTFESDSAGYTNLNFTNIPSQSAYSISSYFQFVIGDILPSSARVSLGKSPDNIYISLNTTSNGYRYKWLTGIGNNSSYQVDLSSTDPTLEKTIPIPPSFNCSYRLSGYLPSGEHAKGLCTIDNGYQIGNYTDSITLHYPATIFSDFQFYINSIDPADAHKQWYQYDFGVIPNQIDHLDGNILIMDSTPNHFLVQVSGTFDRLGSTWICDPIGSNRYQWTVYGSPINTSFVFPVLPADLAAQFTGFTSDSLKLSSVEIKDFSEISSYDDLIKSMFVSGNYIANLVPKYSGLIYNITPSKSGNKSSSEKSF